MSTLRWAAHVPRRRPHPAAAATANRSQSTSSCSSPRIWPGLNRWRTSPPVEDRSWGPTGPQPPPSISADDTTVPSSVSASSLSGFASLVLSTPDPCSKSHLSHLAFTNFFCGKLSIGVSQPPDFPARPEDPVSVKPKEVGSHKSLGVPLNAYVLHNLAHVELNAIDLAWDTVARFSKYCSDLGEQFFADFARVADDESRHFRWCSQRLSELGFSYGDMPAHNFLWRECEKTSGNVAARLAMIPMVQEARGLDAGPRLVQKLVGFGDHRTSSIVAKIAEEEMAHVAVGVYLFSVVCQKMGRMPDTTFRDLLKEYNVELKGPFNYSAREEAGIPRSWYDASLEAKSDLSEVHDRLACIISMEKENAG